MGRILSVVWYKVLPAVFGGQKGIATFSEHLGNHHELTMLCSRDNTTVAGSYEVVATLPTGRMQVLAPSNWLKIYQQIRQISATHLLLEHCYYGIAGILAKSFAGVRLILHEHNIESERFRQMGKWWWPLLFFLERETCRKADLVLFKTKDDMVFAISRFGIAADKCMIVPFGTKRSAIPTREEKASAREIVRERHQIGKGTRIFLFSGTLDYAPNAEALESLVTEIIPSLRKRSLQPFKLIACGRIRDRRYHHLTKLKDPDYIFAGEVADIHEYLLGADLFLNPVTGGGGIKVKTMEALSYNLTVISTRHSAVGIDDSLTGDKLRISPDDDKEQFMENILHSSSDDTDLPKEFFRAYGWDAILAPIVKKIDAL
jgi:hypothetical protein